MARPSTCASFPILMGGAMVFVSLGVAGNILQDLLYTALDPRVDTDSL